MIADHRKAQHIDPVDPVDPGQFLQPSSLPPSQTSSSLSLGVAQLLPLLPVRVVFSRPLVLSAQIRASHAPIDQMKRPHFL